MEITFTTITDLYNDFRDFFEEEPDNLYEIVRDLKDESGKRYEEITVADLNQWYEEIQTTPGHWSN